MTSPTLNQTMKQTCDVLRKGAVKQVTDYEEKFSSLKNVYKDFLSNLIQTSFDTKTACQTAEDFFGEVKVPFAGIDGTMYSKPLFDMVIFFGGAYAARGTIKFSETGIPEVEYEKRSFQQSMGISSVVPIYVNEILDIDHSYSAQEQPEEVNPAKPVTDEEIADNSLIANAIMTFSEYYLAYKIAADINQKTRIILMDRSLSTERASLLYETRKTDFWGKKSTLIGFKSSKGDEASIDKNDLIIARQHISNKSLGLPPARADYLRTSIMCWLEQNKSLTANQIASEFDVTDEKRKRRIEEALRRLTEKQILVEKEGAYSLNSISATSWDRIKKITVEIGDDLFCNKSTDSIASSPMKIIKNGKEQWLTTLDITFLTLFSLHMLMEECWKRSILLIGVTKDTSARDFKRQFVPIMQQEGLLRTALDSDALQQLPNTDRMILQSASIFNSDKIVPPWSLIEYDSAFRTMLPDRQSRRGYVSGVIRNKISLERAFVKSYVQLSQAKSDPLLRSNVLLIDRLAYPEYDCTPESLHRFWNELSDGTKEPVETILYKDNRVPNKLQNLCMTVLTSMAPANIPEAFGHNKALFIADKIAKWNFSQFKCIVDTTAVWILNNPKLRKFIFYMSTFRERRASIEQTRRERH
jgi:hypothetical protein